MMADACPLPVPERSVQGEEGLVKSGGNSDPLIEEQYALWEIGSVNKVILCF